MFSEELRDGWLGSAEPSNTRIGCGWVCPPHPVILISFRGRDVVWSTVLQRVLDSVSNFSSTTLKLKLGLYSTLRVYEPGSPLTSRSS